MSRSWPCWRPCLPTSRCGTGDDRRRDPGQARPRPHPRPDGVPRQRTPRPTTATRPTRRSSTRPSSTTGSPRPRRSAGNTSRPTPTGRSRRWRRSSSRWPGPGRPVTTTPWHAYRELIAGLDPNDQEEFAASFSDTFAGDRRSPPASSTSPGRSTRRCSAVRREPEPAPEGPGRPEAARPGRHAAPAFAVEDIQGRPSGWMLSRQVRPAGFLGDLVRPCVAELPRMQAAYRDYHDAGFEIIGVSLDESKAAVVDFVKARKLPWPQSTTRAQRRPRRGLRRQLDPRDLPDRPRRHDHPARPPRQGPRRDPEPA